MAAVTLGSGTSSTPAYLLRVMGTAADQNKTITFKAFHNNLVYSFTTTATFTGEYVTPIPLDLYLDAVTGITLSDTELEIAKGSTKTLDVTVAPDNATDKTVTWSSSDEAIATVADGVVTAVAVGTSG